MGGAGATKAIQFANAAADTSEPVATYYHSVFALEVPGDEISADGYVLIEGARKLSGPFRPVQLSDGGALRLSIPQSGAVVGLKMDECSALAAVPFIRINRMGISHTGNPTFYLYCK